MEARQVRSLIARRLQHRARPPASTTRHAFDRPVVNRVAVAIAVVALIGALLPTPTVLATPTRTEATLARSLIGALVTAPQALDLGTLGGSLSRATAVSGNIVVGDSQPSTSNPYQHAFAYDLGAAAPQMLDLGYLGVPGGGCSFCFASSHAAAVSGSIVVGNSTTTEAGSHAFVYDLGSGSSQMIDLGNLSANPAASSEAVAVSGNAVVGDTYTDLGFFHAFAFVVGGGGSMTDLGVLGDRHSYALAVSGDIAVGELDGVPEVVGTGTHAFVSGLSGSSMADLGTLGGSSSTAGAVSGTIVVGASTATADPSSWHAFAYDLGAASPSMIDLGTLGGSSSTATAVSGSIVVGTSATTDGASHAFAYDLGAASPSMIDLGTLGGSSSTATAVSGSIVVGTSATTDGASHAFAYDLGAASPSMIDLGTLGGSSSTATAVSGGIVVGSAALAGDLVRHAAVWRLGSGATDQPPSDIALSPASVGAYELAGTVVGSFSTTDPDPADTFAYSLVPGAGDTDNGDFAISASTLVVSAQFINDPKDSYSIRVRSTDAGGLFVEKPLIITTSGLDWTIAPRYSAGGSIGPTTLDVRIFCYPQLDPSVGATAYQWHVETPTHTTLDPIITHDCSLPLALDAKTGEGVYPTTVVAIDAEGHSVASAQRDIVVQDFLIASIGDSVGSGEGNPDVLRTRSSPAEWQDQNCHRSHFAGSALASLKIEDQDPRSSVTFLHLACSGASVSTGILGEYSGIEGKRVNPPQLAALQSAASGRTIDALLISEGGNDIQFSDVMTYCAIVPDCATKEQPKVQRALDGLAVEFELMNACISGSGINADALCKAALSPKQRQQWKMPIQSLHMDPHRVYITEYYDPTTDENGTRCTNILGGISQAEADWFSGWVVPRLNTVIRRAAAMYGWNVVGGAAQAFEGHGYCANDASRWIVTLTELLAVQGGKAGTMHPNVFGHQWYADRLSTSLSADLFPDGGLPRLPD